MGSVERGKVMTFTPDGPGVGVQSGGKRPKDGSRTKVIANLEGIATGTGRMASTDPACLKIETKATQIVVDSGAAGLYSGMIISPSRHRNQCLWQNNPRYCSFTLGTDVLNWNKPVFRLDYYHAIAHLITPDDVALHGTEFITNLVDLSEKLKFEGMNGAESKRLLKNELVKAKIKTFKRKQRPPKAPETLAREILAMRKEIADLTWEY